MPDTSRVSETNPLGAIYCGSVLAIFAVSKAHATRDLCTIHPLHSGNTLLKFFCID